MKIRYFILVSACIMGLTQPVWGQKVNQTATPGSILGYLDPKTGAFRPLVQNPVETGDAEMPKPRSRSISTRYRRVCV
jgi:hypothetical protein